MVHKILTNFCEPLMVEVAPTVNAVINTVKNKCYLKRNIVHHDYFYTKVAPNKVAHSALPIANFS